MNVHYRQGDVLLLKVDDMPPDVVPVEPDNNRVILAYGEVTGHAHALSTATTTLFQQQNTGDRFLQVKAPSALVHEEHNPIDLSPGVYKVIRQREYTPREVRFVSD